METLKKPRRAAPVTMRNLGGHEGEPEGVEADPVFSVGEEDAENPAAESGALFSTLLAATPVATPTAPPASPPVTAPIMPPLPVPPRDVPTSPTVPPRMTVKPAVESSGTIKPSIFRKTINKYTEVKLSKLAWGITIGTWLAAMVYFVFSFGSFAPILVGLGIMVVFGYGLKSVINMTLIRVATTTLWVKLSAYVMLIAMLWFSSDLTFILPCAVICLLIESFVREVKDATRDIAVVEVEVGDMPAS